MERPYFPMFIDMTDKSVLVAGGGRIALRRVRTMLRFGAQVRVAAPELCPELAEMERSGQICAVHRAYETGDLEGVSFVLAATDSREVNRQIWGDCREKGIPVNDRDHFAACTPSVLRAAVRRRFRKGADVECGSSSFSSRYVARKGGIINEDFYFE